MADGSFDFRHQVYNESGYVLNYGNIAEAVDLLQSYPPNPYTESATGRFPLGTSLSRGKEEWVYCQSDSTGFSTIGTPIQSLAAVHAEQDDDIVCGASSAIGDYTVTVTSTANIDTGNLAVEDGLKGGYLIINDEAGQGQMYKIKGNEAFVTTGDSIVTLYDPLTVALTTSSEIGIVADLFKDVLATTAVVSGLFIGVNQIAVTADYYFWAKCKGPAPVVAHAAIAKGSYVVVGTTAAKADPAAAFTTELIIGEAITPAVADTEQFMCWLYGR